MFRNSLIAALIATSLGTAVPAPAQTANQDGLRAAIVVNILRLTEFRRPADGGRRVLCVAPGAYNASFSALDGLAVGQARLDVRRLGSSGDVSGCDAAYVGDGRPPSANILTIGDSSAFIGRGGVVGLVRFGRELRFEISPAAGQRAGVTFSSRLLRLAIIRRS